MVGSQSQSLDPEQVDTPQYLPTSTLKPTPTPVPGMDSNDIHRGIGQRQRCHQSRFCASGADTMYARPVALTPLQGLADQ